METKRVIWVVPDEGTHLTQATAELQALGFQVTPVPAKDAQGTDADLRILPFGAFDDPDIFTVEYGHDYRPTLVLVESRSQEHAVLGFARHLDEIGPTEEPAAITAKRLARLAARYTGDARLHDLLRFDPLTGLPSRRLLELSLRRAVAAPSGGAWRALVFLDLDQFKLVNDSFGHVVGDRLLLEVGRRLLRHRRPGEIVVRFGGDQFAFLLIRNQRQALHDDAERIRRAIGDAAFPVDGHAIAITASAGLAFIEAGQLPTAIFRNGDHAAYEAKSLGGNVLVDFVKSPLRKANEDELTGLPNRWYFKPKLAGEIERSVHDGTVLTVALIDLDRFGIFNRTYGMPTADAVLRRFAEIATGCIRPADSLCRVGGDEFCLVMPDTPLETAGEIAERIRATVAAAQVHSFDGRPISITLSSGVVAWAADCGTLDGLMQKSSEAVQEAKRGGGNRVYVRR